MRIGAGVLLARRYFLTSFKMTLRYRPAEEPGGTDFIIVTPHTHGPMEPSTSVNERTTSGMAMVSIRMLTAGRDSGSGSLVSRGMSLS